MRPGPWIAALLLACPLLAAAQNCMLRDANLRGRYEGGCLRGWANGQGVAEGKDRYEGAFMDGHAHGQGVYTFADGTRFEGLFVQGRVNGLARFHYAGGDVLEGEFRHNRLQGVGRLLRKGGETVLVELRGATLMPVPVQPPVPTAGVPGADGGTPALPQPTGAPRGWEARLDFEDLFPSFILANATRKAPSAGARSAATVRADPLASADPGGLLQAIGQPAPEPQARWTGTAGDAQYLGDPWGLVGIRVRSEAPGTRVTLRVAVQDFADPTEAEFTLPSTGVYAIYPKLRYRFDRLKDVAQPQPVHVHWAVWINGQAAGSHTATVRMRATQDAPIFVRTQRGFENMTQTFAAFVTEDAPWIDALLKEAFDGTGIVAKGYQSDPDGVDKQVWAVFNHLKRRGVVYSNITTTSSGSEQVLSQTVRFPSDSMRTAQANCVDGTVLMASILRKIDIEPMIVMGPGHAMLGYFRKRPGGGGDPDFRIVETTMIGSASFPDAVRQGMATFERWATKDRNHPMFNIIQVRLAREAGVMPIAR